MSKKSKTKAGLKRSAAKASRKANQKKLYEGYMKTGKNIKSKRAISVNNKNKKGRAGNHPFGECGNPGCIKCYGVCFRPFLKDNQPKGMPHWMWLRWDGLTKQEQKRAA